MADTKLYDILGVTPRATDDEIKKSYRKLAKQMHPDRNPTPEEAEKFKEVTAAYEILSNEEKRRTYDRYGMEGIQGGSSGPDMDDLLGHMFGGGGGPFGGMMGGPFGGIFGGGGRRRGPSKGQDKIHPLAVKLEDLYNGKVAKLQMTKNAPCTTCNGYGGREGSRRPCSPCRGRGVRVTLRPLGPGMVQQMQSTCTECSGEGETFLESDKCATCKGTKLAQVKKLIEVHIDKGMRDNEKIVFRDDGDFKPGDSAPGDLIVVLRTEDHETFERRGHDLYMTKKISLVESLCGLTLVIKALDGRDLVVRTLPGEVIKPNCIKGVRGEGMPIHRNPFEKGNLYIRFDVEFPEKHFAPEDQIKQLETLLPPRPTQEIQINLDDEHTEEVGLDDYEPTSNGTSGGARHMDATNSDDEEGEGGEGVRCATQ